MFQCLTKRNIRDVNGWVSARRSFEFDPKCDLWIRFKHFPFRQECVKARDSSWRVAVSQARTNLFFRCQQIGPIVFWPCPFTYLHHKSQSAFRLACNYHWKHMYRLQPHMDFSLSPFVQRKVHTVALFLKSAVNIFSLALSLSLCSHLRLSPKLQQQHKQLGLRSEATRVTTLVM